MKEFVLIAGKSYHGIIQVIDVECKIINISKKDMIIDLERRQADHRKNRRRRRY